MTHGSYPKRRASERRPRSSGLCVRKKTKILSLKNQIRSAERVLRRNLPPEAREIQEKKLDELKKQQEIHSRLAIEREIFLRERKLKFLERRKIERRIRRLERQHRASSNQALEAEISAQLFNLKEDLEYVRFFPKREKYLSLFNGGEDEATVEKRNRLREMIKANLVAAAANGKDLEETGSEDDGILDLSDCEFFLSGSSSDEADADDELTDKGARATSGVSSDERNQEPTTAPGCLLMPPPPPPPRFVDCSTSSNTTSCGTTKKGSSHSLAGQTGNMSSSSDARKPRRQRRSKKKQRRRRP